MSIQVENLCFDYGTSRVLKNVTFSADYGEFLSVLGPNGVGKSTLFRCLLGLLKPGEGSIRIDEKPIFALNAGQLARRIAYIPQSSYPAFHYSVFDMVLMGTTSQRGSFSAPGQKQKLQAESALQKLGIAGLRERAYGKLSGGERQLVLIARAVAQQARILIMDEPTASLDFGNRVLVMQTVARLKAEGYCVIQSTHDPEQAYQYSDKILALQGGRVIAWGNPQETVTDSLISRLYGVDVEVCSLQGDRVRVCLPRERKKG